MSNENYLEEKLNKLKTTPSDVYKHLDTLKKYSSECEHVVEFGTRSIVATWALLAGKPKTLKTFDINHPSESEGDLPEIEKCAEDLNVDFKFYKENVLLMDKGLIGSPDFLFLDTYHFYDQLKWELARYSEFVKKYIAFHDINTFWTHGELEKSIGIGPAILEFLKESDGKWKIVYVEHINNGLLVIERV